MNWYSLAYSGRQLEERSIRMIVIRLNIFHYRVLSHGEWKLLTLMLIISWHIFTFCGSRCGRLISYETCTEEASKLLMGPCRQSPIHPYMVSFAMHTLCVLLHIQISTLSILLVHCHCYHWRNLISLVCETISVNVLCFFPIFFSW